MKFFLFSLALINFSVYAQEGLPLSQAPYTTCRPCAGKLFFIAQDNQYGRELWVTDGTTAGTHIVVDAVEGPGEGIDEYLQCKNDFLYFNARAAGIWRTDGTDTGTSKVYDKWVQLFVVTDTKLIVQDLTPAIVSMNHDGTGVKTVKSFPSGGSFYILNYYASSTQMFLVGNYFDANFKVYKTELWVTDGSAITLLKDVDGAYEMGSMAAFVNDKLLFNVYKKGDPLEDAWVTDATKEGTMLLAEGADIYSGKEGMAFLLRSTNADMHTWITDGTSEGTAEVSNDHAWSAAIENDDRVYLSGWNNSGSYSLIVRANSDLQIEKQLTMFQDSDNRMLGNLGDKFLFAAKTENQGVELFSDDGETTSMIKDIYPGAASSSPHAFGVIGSTAIFLADDGVHGSEFWRTDGTTEGTSLLKDIANENPITGLDDEGSKSIFIYPNPATHNLFVKANGPSKLRIIDMSGGEKYNQPINENVSIDVSSYADGIYVVILNNKQFKFIKRH